MFEKKTLFVAVVVGLLLLLVSVQYTTFGSGSDNAHAAGFSGPGNADDNLKVYLPVVINSDIERDALMALYNSANGPSWTINSGWGVGAPCDMEIQVNAPWHGVSCDSGHVQGLSLTSNRLSGSIPAELGNLSRLITLNLGANQLSGSIPAELGSLSNLIELYLRFNQLSGSIPPELGNLSSLRGLDLAFNQLSGSIPAKLSNLSSLERLYLHFNQPSLSCWETEEALNWARGLSIYVGPDAVCP